MCPKSILFRVSAEGFCSGKEGADPRGISTELLVVIAIIYAPLGLVSQQRIRPRCSSVVLKYTRAHARAVNAARRDRVVAELVV